MSEPCTCPKCRCQRCGGPKQADRVITIRLPPCLHEELIDLAATSRSSMNRVSIDALHRFVIARRTGEEAGECQPRSASAHHAGRTD